ncbi:hypothetical protein GCM10022386_00730 [Flavobacterium cheonhonense]|uniref:TLDc domain-containing protein n=1 Tax=Flavobacterium cheonhonense TaxID=706185 RepID=A0ABP7T6R1_9FLAO|nr:hypothetical protein [Flavobacterium cheonhonense]
MSIFRTIKKNKDGTFGPTSNSNYYKPMYYHNKTAKKNKDKTKWIIKQNEQYCTFELSDDNNWKCLAQNGFFSILENGNVILGSNEEVLGFFPETINDSDPYHGYPVTSSEYEISDKLLEKWLNDKVIDSRMHVKLLKCQI